MPEDKPPTVDYVQYGLWDILKPIQNFALNSNPVLATREAKRARNPHRMTDPANIWACRYRPWLFWIRAPARGAPVKVAKLTTVKTIPILTPALFKSTVKLDRVAGNKAWIPAENRPYTTENAMSPGRLDTAAQQYTRMLAPKTTGIKLLRGPKNRSAR